MSNPYAFSLDELNDSIRYFEKMTRIHARNGINSSEYTFNIFLRFMHMHTSHWFPCLEVVPTYLVEELFSYLRKEVEAYDFMPNPGASSSFDRSLGIEEFNSRMRPFYIALFELVKKRLDCVQYQSDLKDKGSK